MKIVNLLGNMKFIVALSVLLLVLALVGANTAYPSSNLIPNGEFETMDGWTSYQRGHVLWYEVPSAPRELRSTMTSHAGFRYGSKIAQLTSNPIPLPQQPNERARYRLSFCTFVSPHYKEYNTLTVRVSWTFGKHAQATEMVYRSRVNAGYNCFDASLQSPVTSDSLVLQFENKWHGKLLPPPIVYTTIQGTNLDRVFLQKEGDQR